MEDSTISPAATFAAVAIYQLTPLVNVLLLYLKGGVRLVNLEEEYGRGKASILERLSEAPRSDFDSGLGNDRAEASERRVTRLSSG